MGAKQKRGVKGAAALYTTRNAALNKLQLKLADFRRLCILKGVHPREPRKKVKGQNKTYYHVKDVSFLLHEPLLEAFRSIRAFEKKVKKAKAKGNAAEAERLKKRAPEYTLDHLVRERYPSFVDALRDLDDPLTLLHLFATLPAEKAHGIPPARCDAARRLTLEFQSYVVRTHALRKAFVSVKGYYFQAEVHGQLVTWLVPHQLSQVLPEDVDYRVMLTFLEFYETLMGFVNFRLFTSLGAKYPPALDGAMDGVAAGLLAVIHDVASGGGAAVAAAGGAKPPPAAAAARAELDPAARERMATLQQKLRTLERASPDEAPEADAGDAEEAELREAIGAAAVSAADAGASREAMEAARREAEACEGLFKGLVFFVGREVPREQVVFVIRAFGGAVAWDGEGSPLAVTDPSITHQIVDRPSLPADAPTGLSREFVQPQWVFDSANFRVLAPTHAYAPGAKPPPHVSPFVNADAEGYVPEYAQTLQLLAEGGRPGDEGEDEPGRGDGGAEEEEERYAAELAAEFAGKAYGGEGADEGNDEEDEPAPKPKKRKTAVEEAAEEEKQLEEMTHVMLPRKQRELYKAMQMGISKKGERVAQLKERAAKRTRK